MMASDTTSPLVSVILSCFNCEKYVESAVDSIRNQTYKNLEILITDDCSTDCSYTILKRLAEKDSRIILMRNEVNLKLAKNLNKMIAIAKGEYIARMDADDISLPDRIEKQVLWLENHPDYGILGTDAWRINDNGNKTLSGKIPVTNEEINRAKYYINPFYHPSVMFRGNIIKNFKYNEDLVVTEDYELWFSILEKNKGFNLKQKLLLYRDYSESTSNMRKNKQQAELIRIFSENVTNHDTLLAEQYVCGFFLRNKRINSDELNRLLLNMFGCINDTEGYNFKILLRFFVYYLQHKNLAFFLSHLTAKDNIFFFLKLTHYMIWRLIALVVRRLSGIT
jgi:glycosyltransferase involved in cell wall biosynthesis